MMLFDTNPSDVIVIVPPEPDFAFRSEDEFTYSNLYCYDDGDGAASADPLEPLPLAGGVDSDGSSAALAEDGPSDEGRAKGDPDGDGGVGEAGDGAKRDPRNGAFTFSVNAEYDLLMHVQKDLDGHRGPLATDVRLCEIITRSVDEYCLRKQWMFHIGREKGVAIGRFLKGGAEDFCQQPPKGKGAKGKFNKLLKKKSPVQKFVCVDLGTYCGYSALVLASTLRQFIQDLPPSPSGGEQQFEFHIYTTEVSSKLLNIAQSVFRLAKVDQYITPILVRGDDDVRKDRSTLSQILREEHGLSRIDFLLMDHAKHLYLDDLHDLEGAGMLGAGSRVSADNVVFNQLDAYRDHMLKLKSRGVVESRLEEMNLEYSNNLKDGIEMTVYLKDPPTK